WVPALVVGLVGATGSLVVRRWRPAEPVVGDDWSRLAPRASYLIQAVAALVILSASVFGHAWWLPLATLLGVPALGALLAVSFAVAAGVIRLAAWPLGGAHGWHVGWGRAGGTAAWLTGAVALAMLAAQVAMALGHGLTPGRARVALAALWLVPLAAVAGWAALRTVLGGASAWWAAAAGGGVPAVVALILGVGAAAPQAFRQTVSTELAIGAFLAVVLLVDELRRRTRGLLFTGSAVLVAGAPLAVTWALDQGTGWTLRTALVPVVGALMVLVTVVVAHLVFLGAQYLVIDGHAHTDHADLLTLEEASAFLDWRSVESGRPPLSPRALRRARIVFPTPDSPHGPIQAKVSEIFDSDFPPFWKNFLVLRTQPAPAGGRQLRIDVHVVRGLDSVGAEAEPVPPAILIHLPEPTSG
ncbi:MAG TPA: hypothetical protein VI248_21330, partial [Kineosporiaceae bacterium]